MNQDATTGGGAGEEAPRIVIVGHGHAGGSVAEVAAADGCHVELWGRRPEHDLTAPLRRLVLDRYANASYRQRDVSDVNDLAGDLSEFDWVVVASEPRPQEATVDQLRSIVERQADFYGACRQAGFADPRREGSTVRRAIVRIGSPPAEHPTPAGAELDSPYFAVKRDLEGLAAAHAAMGLTVLTVAPSEIHSPFGTYGVDDPYHRGLSLLDRMPIIHDVLSAAVSDRTVGEAVLTAAACGTVGGWYQASDAALGPGEALRLMAEHLELPARATATWQPEAARHLLDVLQHNAGLDLDVLASHTTGLGSLLDAARAISAAQRSMASAALWWAPPTVTSGALRSIDETNRRVGGELLRATIDQLAPRMLAIVLAMGPDRSDPALDQLDQWMGAPPPSASDRLARLTLAIRRQAHELNASHDVRSSM